MMHSQCNAIHKTIVDDFRVAIVYGKSVRHQPQRVGLTHELADEDVRKLSSYLPVVSWKSMLILGSHDHQEISQVLFVLVDHYNHNTTTTSNMHSHDMETWTRAWPFWYAGSDASLEGVI